VFLQKLAELANRGGNILEGAGMVLGLFFA
jgi:hypothetical protein